MSSSCESTGKYTDQFTLIYVDLSSSQDEESVSGMIKKIDDIFLGLPSDRKNKLVVQIIDKDNSVQSLFDREIEPLSSGREIKKKLYHDKMDSLAMQLRDTITSYFENIAFKKPRFKESCICNSLENAHLLLAGIDTNSCEIKIIVLSDMFEECSKASSFFKVDFYMCSNGSKQSTFKELKATIANNYSPKHLLSELVKPQNLHFILTESDLYNEKGTKCLNVNEVEELWSDIINKMGYNNRSFNHPGGITYSVEVPEKLRNK
jgi:hypothetical protein